MRRPLIPIAAAVCVLLSLRIAEQRQTAQDSDHVVRAVILGDSVAHGAGDESGRGIAGWLDDELRARHASHQPTVNLGINGARTANVLRLLRERSVRSALASANLVILSIGGNDLYGDSIARIATLLSPSLAIARVGLRVKMVVAQIHHINPAARIVVLGLYDPYRALSAHVNAWDAHLIAMFASDRATMVERITDLLQSPGRLSSIDHFHPSASGYALIASRIATYLCDASAVCGRTIGW